MQDSIWVSGEFVPDAPEGSSIGLFPNGADNNRSMDWREFRFPTLGKRNLFALVLSNGSIMPDSLAANGGSAALLSVRVGNEGSGLGGAEADLSAIGGVFTRSSTTMEHMVILLRGTASILTRPRREAWG